MSSRDQETDENTRASLASVFSKKYEDNTYKVPEKMPTGSITLISTFIGLHNILPKSGEALIEFETLITHKGREYRYRCLFTVEPSVNFSKNLTLADVLNNRKLTQYYLVRTDVETEERQEIELKVHPSQFIQP